MLINLLTSSFDVNMNCQTKHYILSFTVKPFNDVVITIIIIETKTKHKVNKRIINEIILHN